MDPQRRLTYLSGEQIFSFLAINSRYHLSRKCPKTRDWNRKLPFRLENLTFSAEIETKLNLDGLEWKFEDISGSDGDKTLITLPSKREVQLARPNALETFLKYYFGRKGTKIGNFCFKLLCTDFYATKPIEILKIFENSYFQKFEFLAIGSSLWRAEDTEKLKNLNIQTVNFTLRAEIFNDFPTNLNFSKHCEIFELGADDSEFVERCQEFLVEGNRGCGSQYRAIFQKLTRREMRGFWGRLERDLNAKMKYKDGRCGMCAPIDSETELFITACEGAFHPFIVSSFGFNATVQKTNLSVPYQVMSLREKLCDWKLRRHFFVFEMLTRLEVFIAEKMFNVKLWKHPVYLENDPNLWKIVIVGWILNWISCNHMFILTFLLEVLIFLLFIELFPISLIISLSLLSCVCFLNYLCFRPSFFQKFDFMPFLPSDYYEESSSGGMENLQEIIDSLETPRSRWSFSCFRKV